MKIERIRDITLIGCAIVFVIVYSISNLAMIIAPSWYGQQTNLAYSLEAGPSIYADCQTNDNINTLSITISNYGQEDLKDVKCNLVDKSGLTSTEDSQIISTLGAQSTDICTFELGGIYKKPLKFEVTYGDKSIKQVAQCYPGSWV